ncbi:MAG: hypothetical protein IPG91_04565 [Ideonella sp.]|nr:hypothetical protein [Ideonella sp.]
MSAGPDNAPGAAQATTPPARHGAWRTWLWASAATVLALPLLALGGIAWLATSASGTAWLVARVPGLTVTAPQGSLIGDFAAERVIVALPGSEDRILIHGLRWQGLALARAQAAPAWLRIEARALHAARVELRLALAAGSSAPQGLESPVELALETIDIGEFIAPQLGEQPLRALHARIAIGADGGRLHRFDDLALEWDRLVAHGSLQIASAAPLEVQAGLAIESRADAAAGAAFGASLTLRGPLARLALQGTLRGAAQPAARNGSAPPAADVEATLTPFADWPLAMLGLRTEALDLAALHSAAPSTALDGTAQLRSSASDRPATLAIALANKRAGRYDAGLLPLRSVQAELQARPDDPARGEIHALDLALGTAREAGGRMSGGGHWAPGQMQLDLRLTDLAPRVLDARAAALRVSGQATLAVAPGADAATPPVATLRGRFSGGLPADGRLRALKLELDADASTQRVELRRALLTAGATRVALQGRAERGSGSGSDWRIAAQATLDDFDPAAWWPGREGSAWRKGPHRIDATLAVQGLLPRPASGSVLDTLARARGQATLQLGAGSVLGGQGIAGEIALRGADPAASSPGTSVDAYLAVGGSTVSLRGRLAPDAADHWEIESHGADLGPWSALAALGADAGSVAPGFAGKLDAALALDGRWPRVATRGTLALDELRAGASLRVGRAALRWTASSAAPQAPLDVQADLDRLDLGVQKIDSLRLRIAGSTAAHRIVLDGATPARPPRWLDLLHGADSAPGTGTRAELRAEGSLQIDAEWLQPLRWQGKLQ